jgi:hypothetical protein
MDHRLGGIADGKEEATSTRQVGIDKWSLWQGAAFKIRELIRRKRKIVGQFP